MSGLSEANRREPATTSARGSRWIRRIHLYLGLFLVPWVLLYAVSTAAMNHRELVTRWLAGAKPVWRPVATLDYSRDFPTNLTREAIGRLILDDLDLPGRHRVSGGRDGRPLVIERQQPLGFRRITFDAAAGRLTIEAESFQSQSFLERIHRRRGYEAGASRENGWAFGVDLAMGALLFWALSGLWLWWEMPATRRLGLICLGGGAGLFALLLSRL